MTNLTSSLSAQLELRRACRVNPAHCVMPRYNLNPADLQTLRLRPPQADEKRPSMPQKTLPQCPCVHTSSETCSDSSANALVKNIMIRFGKRFAAAAARNMLLQTLNLRRSFAAVPISRKPCVLPVSAGIPLRHGICRKKRNSGRNPLIRRALSEPEPPFSSLRVRSGARRSRFPEKTPVFPPSSAHAGPFPHRRFEAV